MQNYNKLIESYVVANRSKLSQFLTEDSTVLFSDALIEQKTPLESSTSSQGQVHADIGVLSKSKTSKSNNRLTVDAVHPLFTSYRSDHNSTNNHRFYCGQCKTYFYLSQEEVNHHFTTIKHESIGNCVYCKTSSVYEYFDNNNRLYYHRCV